MNTRTNPVTTEYTTDNRFAAALLPAASPYRPTAEADLEELKNRLLRLELERALTIDSNVLLRRAANDAAALAWLTPYPLLVLPALFEEKVRGARKNAEKAAYIRRRSSELLTLAE